MTDQSRADSEIALIEKAVLRVGMKSLLNHGAGSLVYTEGIHGVSQEHLIAYTREVALHCAAALSPHQPAPVGAEPSAAVAQKPCGGREHCGRFPFCGCGGPDPLPERDASKSAEQQGLFRKFDVRRTDGSDSLGGKHEGCEYFVLDVRCDPHAKAALAAYATAVQATNPTLAADMRDRYELPTALADSAKPAGEPSEEDWWYDLASRHATKDWNGDGYLNSVKALVRDAFAAAPVPGPLAEHIKKDAKQFADALENDGWIPFHPSDTKALVKVLRSIAAAPTPAIQAKIDDMAVYRAACDVRDWANTLGTVLENKPALLASIDRLRGMVAAEPAEPAAPVRPFAEVVQNNQERYFTALCAPGIDQPKIGEKLYLAPTAPSLPDEGKGVTDAEIVALNAGERFFSESPTKYPEAGHGTQYHCGAPGLIGFARAAIALASSRKKGGAE